jgi:hypothetical protein
VGVDGAQVVDTLCSCERTRSNGTGAFASCPDAGLAVPFAMAPWWSDDEAPAEGVAAL